MHEFLIEGRIGKNQDVFSYWQ